MVRSLALVTSLILVLASCSNWMTEDQEARSELSGNYNTSCVSSVIIGSSKYIISTFSSTYSSDANAIQLINTISSDANCKEKFVTFEQAGNLEIGAVDGDTDTLLTSSIAYNNLTVQAYKTNIYLTNTYITPHTEEAADLLTSIFGGTESFISGQKVDISDIQGTYFPYLPALNTWLYILIYRTGNMLIANDFTTNASQRTNSELKTDSPWIQD
jgi:hypothetical protein